MTGFTPPPKLILAPMENLADRAFRLSLTPIGGFDEAVHEFIRIPQSFPSIPGVLRHYTPHELSIPLAVQIMGSDPSRMQYASHLLASRGAPRIDLNCGCPSRTVTGHGGGARLLQSPETIHSVVRAMTTGAMGRAVVSVKMRSGYEDETLFDENVHAAVEGGAGMITVHPRTKVQKYEGDADWTLIERAKRICGNVQVVGNGDVRCAEDAVRMLETGCDHVMVGRGAVMNPWIFWEIRGRLGLQQRKMRGLEEECAFYRRYLQACGGVDDVSCRKLHKMKIGRFKLLVRYSTAIREEDKRVLLMSDGGGDARRFCDDICRTLQRCYQVD